MLKLSLSVVITCFAVLLGYTQTTEQKVESFLGEGRYTELQSNNSQLLDFLRTRVEEGYLVSQSVEEKKDSYVVINKVFFEKNEISIDDFIQALNSDSFNILKYTFPGQDSGVTKHYLLGDTNILLTVYSNNVINKKVATTN